MVANPRVTVFLAIAIKVIMGRAIVTKNRCEMPLI